MTIKQLKQYTTKELLFIYKEKARCIHSENITIRIYKELDLRIGTDLLFNLRLETWHMQNGEGDELFNTECNRLINLFANKD